MLPFLSLITSIKDYVEVVHKLIETDSNFSLHSYYDFGSVFTFLVLAGKDLFKNFFTFHWFQNLWSLPTIVPDIASSLISEISVFDGSFKNTQTFLESPFSYGNQNFFIYCLEKFTIGFLNSLFLCFPTSIAHIITLRRFVMQGLEAGFLSGLGTIVGNIVWIGSILFGFRFFVIPWLSLDLFRYFLGFLLIVKYMWDSSRERRMVLEDFSKYKIFFLTFLLSFTEQTTIYPFISNLSFGSDSTILESFPAENFSQFTFVHCCYLLGLLLGSLSLLQFTCWFWENPAFQIYMWFLSSFQITKNISSKFVNFFFLYLTMICAIANFSYFGLDYTLTNPLGFVHEDRLFEQKAFLETAFLNTKASDRNTRRNRGRHGRRERWKRRIRKYRTFDASLYDQGIYDLFTIEDLNYGFDRFWLRRKIRNHRVRFRFFPGPWMRNFKKQLSRPRLESFLGPRVEFFRILFEQAYHPEFHEFSSSRADQQTKKNLLKTNSNIVNQNFISWDVQGNKKQRILKERSAFRKFTRKIQTRLKKAKIESEIQNPQNFQLSFENSKNFFKPISSKTWKTFAGIEKRNTSSKSFSNSLKNSSLFKQSEDNFYFQRFYKKLFSQGSESSLFSKENLSLNNFSKRKDTNAKRNLSKKDRFLQRYKNFLQNSNSSLEPQKKNEKNVSPQSGPIFSNKKTEGKTILFSSTDSASNIFQQSFSAEQVQNESFYRPMTLLHPLQFYFQKEQALKRKFQFYGVKLFRNFGVENNAPYFRVLMKRFFYHYKPSLRWERTLRVASTRRARRKSSRIPKKFNVQKSTQILAENENSLHFLASTPHFSQSKKVQNDLLGSGLADAEKQKKFSSDITDPTHFYSLVDKRASRYRFQIYKDVLQHWYYSPLNRLLVKLDVDSFIRRQPNSYFLTKNDEKFLHLKRQLLSEYYETLRWYTSMENYSTMKNQIGGTKSLSSRAYNQQFAGTLKKIRHLFNISPSFRENTVLKFDQPLYNEYTNSFAAPNSILHEELMSENFLPASKSKSNPENFVNQSITILREYLATAAPVRQQYIEKLLKEKNYWDLSQFLFQGQKIRGTRPITNETDFLNQEKDFLFTEGSSEKTNFSTQFDPYTLKDEIWISLLKKCQKKLYDQEALKNYVSLKKEKYEIQKQRHEKYLKNRFTRMKEALYENSEVLLNKNQKNFSKTAKNPSQNEFKKDSVQQVQNFENFSGYPSSLKKAVKESILWENNSLSNSSFQTLEKIFGAQEFSTYGKKLFFEKTNIRKNQFPMYSFLQKENLFLSPKSDLTVLQNKKEAFQMNNVKTRSFIFTKNLHFVVKKQALQILQTEKQVQEKFQNSQKKERIFHFPSIFQSFFGKTKQMFFDLRNKGMGFQTESFLADSSNEKNIQNKTKKILFSPFTSVKNVFQKIFSFGKKKDSDFFIHEAGNKNIEFWKKRENILTKRKKLRKTLKRLRNQKTQTEKILFSPLLQDQGNKDFFTPLVAQRNLKNENRQKTDKNLNEYSSANSSRSWQNYLSSSTSFSKNQVNGQNEVQKNQNKFFGFHFFQKEKENLKKLENTKFQRKRTRLRRYSSFKGRGPIKKRTLREKLKRQFKSLKKYGKNQNTGFSEKQKEQDNKKAELIQFITQRNSAPNGKFLKRDEKQRKTRQMKHRAWKKKKQNFAQKRRKLRKRRRSTLSKIRVYNKKIYRILARKEIQTWWWKTFFPHFQKTTEKTWQMQKNMQIQKQLFELSEKEIFERDQKNKVLPEGSPQFFENSENLLKIDSLQIGNKDFKPFAIPETLRIREKLIQKNLLQFENSRKNETDFEKTQKYTSVPIQTGIDNFQGKNTDTLISEQNKENYEKQIFEKVNNSIFGENQTLFSSLDQKMQTLSNSPFLMSTNPLPFYAGWDNNLRKFVLTNRLLARKDCFSCLPQTVSNGKENVFGYKGKKDENQNFSASEFFQSPLQGMNAATTLYWQIPFTTYDPDQFFALGMDGFSPIGWRNFSFKHSKQTTKPILVKNFYSFDSSIGSSENSQKKEKEFSLDLRFKISHQRVPQNNRFTKRKTEIDKNFEYRRILKKQKRLKKHPRPPVWFPSGSLSQQVLPVHYIYVFYKRSRLPRDRYIRRRLRSNFLNNQNSQSSFVDRTKMIDFTLRKRTKPRRKYHRKRFGDISEKNQFFARRRKFRGFFDETETTRPTSKLFVQPSTTGTKQEKRIVQSKQRRKIQDSKQPNENIRVRQLRRRVQRQVYRPVWRSRPRAGGFVWPGDYLRLELVKASPLKSTTAAMNKNEGILESENSQSLTRKIRKKNRRTLQEWQIQPKRYLFEKHNLKVLKKRLEKSTNLNLS